VFRFVVVVVVVVVPMLAWEERSERENIKARVLNFFLYSRSVYNI
jgi:hypothetical protein